MTKEFTQAKQLIEDSRRILLTMHERMDGDDGGALLAIGHQLEKMGKLVTYAIKKGVPPEAIKVFGIPIQLSFAKRLNKKMIADKLGFYLNSPIFLIMGGGQGLGPIKVVVKSLMKVNSNFQMIVLAGTNQGLVRWLKKIPKKTDKRIAVYEYVDNVDELMEISTLIITKPGGMTTSEALAKGLPMVVINPLPGQEMRNTDFLLKHGVAIRVDKTNDIGEEIDLLLRSPERLAAMRKASLENGHPYAALDISKLILQHSPLHNH